MTDLEKRMMELDEREAALNADRREVLERERAVYLKEQAQKREDIERDDYLFNAINQHRADYRPVVVEVPTQTQTKLDSPLDCLTAISAMLSAAFTLIILVLILL